MSKDDLAMELKNAIENYEDYKYEYYKNGWTFPSPDPAVTEDAIEYWQMEIDRLEKEIKEVKKDEHENN